MSDIALSVENISKMYRLGEVGTGTISHDLNRWWARIRGKEDPFAEVGAVNDRTQKAQKGEYVWVLKDINFKVKQGEVLGIIGKNGAGKSTLLKVISSITAPTKGEIKFNGRIASLLEVGTGMHPELTGKENVFLNGAILGMTKAEIRAKFDDIMDFAGCAKYADTPVKRYSSGMKVRLGFAVAAFLEPEILIVDEVLAVGDAEFQKKAIGKMKEVSVQGGRTVLFVSHNMSSIKALCTRAILLKNGGINLVGSPDEIIDEYTRQALNDEKRISFPVNSTDDNIVLNSFSAKDIQGNVITHIEYDMPFIIEMKLFFKERANAKDFMLGFAVNNLMNQRIFTSHSIDDINFSKNKGGFYEGLVTIESKIDLNILSPGDYLINFGIRDLKHRKNVILVKDILRLKIVQDISSSSRDGKEGVIWYTSKWGIKV